MNKELYENYAAILNQELLSALGCTEPVAVAYCAAKAREILGAMPERAEVRCSGNVIKNVKGVTVPNSGGMKGVAAAAALGITGGNEALELEVLSRVSDEERLAAREFLKSGRCTTRLEADEEKLFIACTLWSRDDTVSVELKTKHNHISRITKNGKIEFEQPDLCVCEAGDKKLLDLKDIYGFACEGDLGGVREILEKQLRMNTAVSKAGMSEGWGMGIGREQYIGCETSLQGRAAAMAAAGSDARMSGCPLPVVINSGSGNQGITITAPVAVYAQALGVPHEKLLRALALANLVSIHQKRFIGNLSAYCGAVSAAAGAACGVAYLYDEPFEVLCGTIINTIATAGGIACDGAKPSCAAKIRTSVDTALFAYRLAKNGRVYKEGDGLVGANAEETIRNVGRMGRVGMAPTDTEILNIMLGN